jgi:hypothetical protein
VVTALAECIPLSRPCESQVTLGASCEGTVRGTARRPNFSMAIISVTVQLWV